MSYGPNLSDLFRRAGVYVDKMFKGAKPVDLAVEQPSGKMHRIGWLSPSSAANGLPNLDALRDGLRDLGYAEGRNVTIEARWADGEIPRLPKLAAELVSLRVDVICTAGSQAAG